MKAYRLGNDINFQWTINGLDDVSGTKVVKLIHGLDENAEPETITYSISGDVVTGLFKGKNQTKKGEYRLLLVVNDGLDDMVTLDYVDCWELTGVCNFGISSGSDEGSIESISVELTSSLDTSSSPTPTTVQSDWEQDDSTQPDYIKHKPIVYTQSEVDALIDLIKALIPSAASSSNQLADKSFVNSSISTSTATFRGTYNTLADLQAVTGADNNDYGFVIDQDTVGNEFYNKYKYNGSQWVFEYKIESTSFTSAQWAAIQSGITSSLVTKLNALPTATELSNAFAAKQDTISDLSSIRSGASAGATALQPVSSPTSGNFAGVDSNGNVVDSGSKASDFETVTTIEAPVDQTDPTDPITTLTCEVGKYYRIAVAIETLAVTLPAMTDTTHLKTITLFLTGGTTPAITFASATSGVNAYKAKGFTVESGKTYEISCLWNGVSWIVAQVEIELS